MDQFSLDSFALILIFFCVSPLLVSPPTAATAPATALLSFKSLLFDPLGSLASWNDNGSLQYCVWRGVTCGIRHPLQVVALDLSSLRLAGPISPTISNLTFLKRLRLSNNQLYGRIPEELGRLYRLRQLNLSINNLEGEIPPSLGNKTSLSYLNLGSNSLSGGIPPFFSANLSPLNFIRLTRNSLTGDIPPSLGNLSSLQYLLIADNYLEGSIPESLGSIPSLQVLDVSLNYLSNRIPSSVYNHSTITYLGAQLNRLSGTLPTDMGLTLPNLQSLLLYNNTFEGSLQISLSNASRLENLLLGNNFFSRSVPSNLGHLQNLRVLDIGGNQLQSRDLSFLSSLTNCTLLETLYLYNNELEGALPTSVGDLSTRLEKLSIRGNQISGVIPAEIGNLVGLTELTMGRNLLVGSIPATIGKLRSLHVLGLARNNLSGPIPSTIGNLNQLNKLYVDDNELSGDVPVSIGGCKALVLLDLSRNVLAGTIPRELLGLSSLTQYLDLSHNYLIGSMPMEVGHLINLGILDVSENQLSGDIPPTLGTCLLLEQLHMEGNFFQGSIPQSFAGLKGLKELDLSRNNLSGQIPDYLESFGSLHSLNLSFNHFEGEVPSGHVFNNASEISILGNTKLCGGYPELGLPSCSAHGPARRISLLKVIIPTVVSAVIILLLLLSLFCILYARRWKRGINRGTSRAPSFEAGRYKIISYADIYKATDGFSSANLVGAGSFGSVYRGKIDSEESIDVAVKVLNLHRKGSSRSFTAECEALRNIRHRNLVKIITTCSSLDRKGNDFKALVFEYMPNESLEKWLHPEVGLEHSQPRKLTLIQRLNIAIDVVSALEYLHHDCQPPVVHCDLKPSNILLDDDMMAHVGDFGLAKLLAQSIPAVAKNSTSSISVKGSVGYIAPEYGIGSQVSTKGDVYSFGILLLEMMTRKKPTDDMFKDGFNIRRYAEKAFIEGDMKILDPQLVLRDEGEATEGSSSMNAHITRERSTRSVFSLVRVGLLCSNDTPSERMEMKDVAAELHTIKVLFFNG